jgi:hypothetical protein
VDISDSQTKIKKLAYTRLRISDVNAVRVDERTWPIHISTLGTTNKSEAVQAAIAHRMTGLTLDHVQFPGIHFRLSGSLSRDLRSRWWSVSESSRGDSPGTLDESEASCRPSVALWLHGSFQVRCLCSWCERNTLFDMTSLCHVNFSGDSH